MWNENVDLDSSSTNTHYQSRKQSLHTSFYFHFFHLMIIIIVIIVIIIIIIIIIIIFFFSIILMLYSPLYPVNIICPLKRQLIPK